MSAKFVSVTIGDKIWLGLEWGSDKRVLLHPQGYVGDCIRPGQRLHPDRLR